MGGTHWLISTGNANAGPKDGSKYGNPGAVTYSVAIEYPIGSGIRTILTWDGATSKLAAGGATITSDFTPLLVAIPDNAAFLVINHQEAEQGIVYTAITGTTVRMTGDYQNGAMTSGGHTTP